MNGSANCQWNEKEVERAKDHIDARAENIIDFANVIGGARHQVADGLQTVKGHAFAQQVDVELFAHIAFDHLRHDLKAKVAHELHEPRDVCEMPTMAAPRKKTSTSGCPEVRFEKTLPNWTAGTEARAALPIAPKAAIKKIGQWCKA